MCVTVCVCACVCVWVWVSGGGGGGGGVAYLPTAHVVASLSSLYGGPTDSEHTRTYSLHTAVPSWVDVLGLGNTCIPALRARLASTGQPLVTGCLIYLGHSSVTWEVEGGEGEREREHSGISKEEYGTCASTYQSWVSFPQYDSARSSTAHSHTAHEAPHCTP